jgi:hypothetical protein
MAMADYDNAMRMASSLDIAIALSGDVTGENFFVSGT